MSVKKILIVDDDENFVMMTKSRLEANNYEVITASNGIDAVKSATEWKPDLVILDLIMPAMEGFDVCKKLKSEEITQRIPIIVLTAATKKETHDKCLHSGALVVILKPFNPAELLALIKKAFDPNSKWRKPESMRNN